MRSEWVVSAWSGSLAFDASAYQRHGSKAVDVTGEGIRVAGEGYDGGGIGFSVPWDVVWWVMALNANAISEGLRALHGGG